MKTLKTLSVLAFLLCCSFYSNAQILCGVQAAFTQNVNPNHVASFYDTSRVDANWQIASWSWNFGDGTPTSSLQNPTHTYTAPGTYTVCLTVTAGGMGVTCMDDVCHTITVGCNTISGNFTSTVSGTTASFVSQFSSNHPPLTYSWNFGDGGTSNDGSPVHTYTTAGVYTVCVTVSDANGCSRTECHVVTVGTTLCGNINASFTITNNGSGVVTLLSTSTGVPSGGLYQWWMDGTALTNPNPNTAFTLNNVSTGHHNFCLYVFIPNQTLPCDSTCRNEYIGTNTCNVSADFQFSVNAPTVTFYPVPNSTPTFSYWSFGDNTVSNDTGVIHHTYPTSPNTITYRVCHYVGIPGTNCIDTVCESIVIPGHGGGCGNASFTTTVSGSGVIHSESTSTGVSSTTQYQWYIWGPNGNLLQTQTGLDDNITSQSLPAGLYRVCLYLYTTNQTFCDSVCHNITIANTNPCAGITADWGFAVLGNDSVRFEAADTNFLANHYWNFGDGTTGTGTHITHHYNAPGTYRVCFVVYIPGINCVDSMCQYVTVTHGPCGNLSAVWTSTYVNGGAVHFIGGTNTLNVTHLWDFGDGSVSTSFDPTHCYTASGLYNVCHIVSIPGTICRDTSCHQIQANACNPCAGFGVNVGWGPNSIFGGFNVEASVVNATPGVTVRYEWSTGDTGRVIRVAQGGIYCVTAISSNGCSAVDCDTVGQNTTPCHAQFTYHFTSQCGRIEFNNNSTGGFNHSTWYFGDGTSSNVTNPVHVFPPGTWTVQLTIYNTNGNCQSTFYAVITVQPCGGNDTICGIVFEDANGNGILDNGEHGIPGAHVNAGNYSANADSNGHYFIVVPSGTYNIFYCAPTGYTYTLPINQNNNGLNCNGYYYVSVIGNGMHCGFDFGIQSNSVSICGTVYLDANNNGVRDNGENGIANVHLEIVGSNGHVYHAYTDQNGHYCVLVPIGTYVIHHGTIGHNTCVTTPQSITVTATTTGQQLNGNDFASYCQPGVCNLRVSITPHTTITAGFPAWYSIQVCNIGTSVSGGTLNMFYDGVLAFDHSSPAPTSHNASTMTLSWDVSPMLPGACRNYRVVFDADTTVTVGQFVFTLVSIDPDTSCNDINMVNNVDTIHQEATASWDPNNKLAYTTNHETSPVYQWVSSVEANQRIEYVINFQNTGNASAVNIVVKDVISADLDINSFEFLGASHPCVVTSANGELNYKFSGIMLPAMGTDEPNSHGWIKFAANAVNGLPGGHIISDPADIYFDYNLPVATNDAAVIMLDATGIDEMVVNNVTVVIAPNPMNQFAEIRLNNSKADNFRFRVTDLTGRLVADKLSNGNSLLYERDALAAGLYTYQVIQNNNVVAKGKLVAQ